MNNKTFKIVNDLESPLSRGAILLVLFLQNIQNNQQADKGQICLALNISERHLRRLVNELESQKLITHKLEGRKKIFKLA